MKPGRFNYLRQTHAHVFQKGYRLRPTGPKFAPTGIKRTRTIPTINETISVQEADDLITEMLRDFGVDENAVAKYLAQKCNEAVGRLSDCYDRMFESGF